MTRWPPPPVLAPAFFKGHGLGNDYLVFEESGAGEMAWTATPANVQRVCDRHRGVGADGIVALLRGDARASSDPQRAEVALRMFNPDGGEFERSGNGLRVLASYLASRRPSLREIGATVGGTGVRMELHGREGPRHDVSVQMGRAVVGDVAVGLDPGAVDPDGCLAGPDGRPLEVVPVSVGNPHLVVMCDGAQSELFSEDGLERIGPFLSTHAALAHGANVQLARPGGSGGCEARIWERGVGRTSASGTSACAVAVAMVSSGRLGPGEVRVTMPGGVLLVTVAAELDVVLRGPVEEVLEGRLLDTVLATFEPGP
jgi:diaminopimelate epimerase